MSRHIHHVVATVLADVMQPVKCSCGEDLVIICPKGCTDAELNASARQLIKERRQTPPVLLRESKNSTPRFEPRVVKATPRVEFVSERAERALRSIAAEPNIIAVPVKRIPLATPAEAALSRKHTEPRILDAFRRAAGAPLKPSDIARTSGMPRTRIEMCCIKLLARGVLKREMPEGRKRGYLYSLVES